MEFNKIYTECSSEPDYAESSKTPSIFSGVPEL
jgi:hypothetical protein